MKKIYNPDQDTLTEKPEKGFDNLVQEFYSRVGEKFPVTWKTEKGMAVPEIETENLPDGVTETDVETVLQNMKADGWF